MAHSHSTATPEATKTSAIAHPPVPDVQKDSELETDRSGMLEARAIQAIGGGSLVTSPNQHAGALGQLSGRSQTSLLRQLQRSYGNSYVGSVIQAKLTVNQPGDIYEQEADRMAAQVVMPKPELPNAPVASVSQPLGEMGIQRQCSECEQGMEEGKDSDEMSSLAGVQTKLTVGAGGDKYEQEADQVAAQVMSMSVAPSSSPQVQRFGEEDNPVQRWSLAQSITPVVQRQVDEQVQMRELVQRAFQTGGNEASGDLESRLNASKGGGSALAPEVRAFMEPRFGADFSSVRVHTGGEAVQMNRELGAQAFAHGSNVYFGAGKSPGNNALTAHELTHVVQQTGSLQRKCPACQEEDSQIMRKGTADDSINTSLASNSAPTTESILQMQGLGIRGQGAQREEDSSKKDNSSAQLSIQTISEQKVMRSLAFDSTVQICRRVLTTKKVQVSQGGLRVVLALKPLKTETPNCQNHDFGVTLTKSIDLWFDNEIATCKADTGGTRSFSFKDLSSGTYYLTISRTFDNPYCCMEGDILVFDEHISGDSSGCIRDKDPSTMDIVHGALDIAGFIPVLGAIPDGINATIYVAEGDWVNAGISAFAMIPAIGDGAKAGVMAGKTVVKVSEKTALKLGEEGLAKAFKEAKAVSKAEEAAKAASKLEKEVAEAASKLEKEAAEKAAKEAAEKAIQKKIKKCLEIYAAKEALGTCKGCKGTDTPTERAAKIACIIAEIGFREAYLKEGCDDVLPESIARKKRGDDPEGKHKKALADKILSLARCSTLPTK